MQLSIPEEILFKINEEFEEKKEFAKKYANGINKKLCPKYSSLSVYV